MSMEYATPPEFRSGCLLRTSLPGERCPLFGDRIEVIPKAEWAAHIGQVSLRPYVTEIFDQDGVGSCASESSTQALQIALAFAGRPWVQLSPWFVYRSVSGGRDSGSSIDDNLEFLRTSGSCPMEMLPRSGGWKAKPSAEAVEAAKSYRIDEYYDITTAEEFGTALLKGFPVVYGRSGHAIVAVELVSPSEIRYCNSWGDWGDGGFAVESLSKVNWGYGAFAVRTAVESTK